MAWYTLKLTGTEKSFLLAGLHIARDFTNSPPVVSRMPEILGELIAKIEKVPPTRKRQVREAG